MTHPFCDFTEFKHGMLGVGTAVLHQVLSQFNQVAQSEYTCRFRRLRVDIQTGDRANHRAETFQEEMGDLDFVCAWWAMAETCSGTVWV